MRVEAGYEELARIFQDALDQAQVGKGKGRHANGKPFHQQPIMEIGRMVGTGGPTFQAIKKAQEAMGLPTKERKKAELLGAINYLAATILLIEEES